MNLYTDINAVSACREFSCSACCRENSMPLTIRDIQRIVKKGFKPEDFIVRKNNERHLRNLEDSCVFLKEGKCTIYPIRPEGCRLYPLIYDSSKNRVIIDQLCPHSENFNIKQNRSKQLRELVKRIKREKRREFLI
ncbi:YkgJ family cysteine cluster protein [Candidatus Bathyarchaeota archaeon]|nr:YkgJ family cysteine cluster protein [Candidatus Bathyarchaeota archaeon]